MSDAPLASTFGFETTDAFSWSGFAGKLEAFLLKEVEFVEGSLVVSLNAKFGSGKTTFLRMWKNHLDTPRESDPKSPLCILLNAWEDDYSAEEFKKQLGVFYPGGCGGYSSLSNLAKKIQEIESFAK
jgi:predicted KAP-like P-loop ATPase